MPVPTISYCNYVSRCPTLLYVLLCLCLLPYTQPLQSEPATQSEQSTDSVSPPNKSIQFLAAIHVDSFNNYKINELEDVCIDFPSQRPPTVDRVILELLIMCEAFTEAGYDAKIKLLPSPNYSRSLRHVSTGVTDTVIDTVWSSDVDAKHLLATAPIHHKGRFEKGIYTTHDHPLQTATINAQSFKKYVGVTFKNWHYDQAMSLELSENMVFTVNFSSLVKMMHGKRADFTLLEFPDKNDLTFYYDELELEPIPNVKVMLPDSRVFVVSKHSPQSEHIYQALNLGINELTQQGRILELYKHYGFVNEQVRDWRTLNPTPPPN